MLKQSRDRRRQPLRSKIVSTLVFSLLLPAAPLFAGDSAGVIDSGNTAWMLTSTALVLLMVPGLAMFYEGLVRTKNVLGTMMHSFAAMGIIGVMWVAVGYSMSFGKGILGGWCGWNPDYFFLRGIDDVILEAGVPEYVFAMFQGKFAIITPALIAGAFAERVQFRGYCLYIALWSVLVYNPLCHWVWAQDGWIFNLGAAGAVDFAGGTVVHISAGVSGLVAALYLGARHGYPQSAMHPNNLVMTLMGAGLLWVGWFGFNAGSAVSSGLATAQTLTATQVAAAAGATTWLIIEAVHLGKATTLGIVSGILAGLVVITPAAGVVKPAGAVALGMGAFLICYLGLSLKKRLAYDDSLDAFGIHGVAGIFGALALVFFIRDSWMLDAAKAVAGSWGVFAQLVVQAKAVAVTIIYTVIVSGMLVLVVEKSVGFRLVLDQERSGMDHALHGEQGYGLTNLN
ncbi:MAG TPA: ammonium transporter [Proteobacteria bacterium]|nr:ammonium transporter [Pseudomonadota bacterium]